MIGPAKEVTAFLAAARGPGVTPWHVDYDRLEEEAFHLALRAPARCLSVAGCRLLAGQFREAVEAHLARGAARATDLQGAARQGSSVCPLDLHALWPVPAPILRLGWADPAADAWLMAHWGATALRRVVRLENPPMGRRVPPGHATAGFSFWALGGRGPDAARLAARFPDLAFRRTP